MLGLTLTVQSPMIPRALSLASLLCLAACGGAKTAAPAAAAPTQVAAKVGKGEVSVHQVNFLLQRQGDIPFELQPKAQREILERLIDQELAVQKAQSQKLDREPTVMQTIEAAKRDIVARAYLERITATVAKPSSDDLKQYYASHPVLFAQRRIYDVQEINALAKPEQVSKIEAKLNTAKTADEIVAVLRGAGLNPDVRPASLVPENIPQGLLDRFATMQVGQPLLLNVTGGVKAITIIGTKSAPLDEAAALPRIETFLLTERKRAAVEKDLKALRADTVIEYTGPFAGAASVPESSQAPAASLPAPTKSSAPANIDDATVNRGFK
jgi:EpsD family peptidyl-prolyl cis-trans isomerase